MSDELHALLARASNDIEGAAPGSTVAAWASSAPLPVVAGSRVAPPSRSRASAWSACSGSACGSGWASRPRSRWCPS